MAPTLPRHLAQLPYKDLRGIATRLGLRKRHHSQKQEWIALIAAGWQQFALQQQWPAVLSEHAKDALWRLLQAEQIPAVLFWAEYGPVRQVTVHQKWSPPPWQAPATVSEELYYSALLCPLDNPALRRTHLVAIPSDLRVALLAHFAAHIDSGNGTEVISVDKTTTGYLGWTLCHDVGQLLIYLHTQPALKLLHGRWLSRAHLTQLATRLLTPVTVQASHRRTPYLRLLMALVTLGELQDQGTITPKGWQWLADEPAAQLTWLWDCWQAMTPDDRVRFALPAGGIASPWPQPLLRQLATSSTAALAPFTAVDLVHGMWRTNAVSAAFWAANFHRRARSYNQP